MGTDILSVLCVNKRLIVKYSGKVLSLLKKSVPLHCTSAMAADILGSVYALFPDGEIGHFAN